VQENAQHAGSPLPRVILLGPPGSGKGTQSVGLAEELGVPHIATGDLFRAAMAAKSDLGKLAEGYISNGNLVPDEVVNGLMQERLGQPDCEGFVLDGYPRTLPQAEALDAILTQLGRPINIAVDIAVDDEVIVERAAGRLVCPNCGAIYHLTSKPPLEAGICDVCRGGLIARADDQPETVRHRLAVYHRTTMPVLDFYRERGVLRQVNGEASREKVGEDVRAQLRTVC
jgi:adenylate kinase